MTSERCKKELDNLSIDYLIVGYKNTGKRCIPAEYEMNVAYANKGNIYNQLESFENYRVFNVSESEYTKDTWDFHLGDYLRIKNENEERELLQQLKKKYE